MKKAAILCPGLSLNNFPGREGFDIVLGVNRAVGAFACDYWVFIDHYTYVLSLESKSPCIGRPAICLDKGVYTQVCIDRPDAKEFPNAPLLHEWNGEERTKSGLFSATRAMVIAYNLGARDLTVWGADWNAATPGDWDGYYNAPWQERKAERLEDQKARWLMTAEFLSARGVSVRRAQEVPNGN
jgi:hypothetical protein